MDKNETTKTLAHAWHESQDLARKKPSYLLSLN